MIWIKRIIPIILLAAVVFGGFRYRDYRKQQEIETAKNNALITAKLWFAQTKFRNDPKKFIAYRDSLLSTTGVSSEDMQLYLNKYQEKPEQYLEFTKWVDYYIDSLYTLWKTYDTKDKPDTIPDSTG